MSEGGDGVVKSPAEQDDPFLAPDSLGEPGGHCYHYRQQHLLSRQVTKTDRQVTKSADRKSTLLSADPIHLWPPASAGGFLFFQSQG